MLKKIILLLLFVICCSFAYATVEVYYAANSGYVRSPIDTWANERIATTGSYAFNSTNTALILLSSYIGNPTIERAFLNFDTSALPDNANITNVTLTLNVSFVSATNNVGTRQIGLVKSNQTNVGNISLNDFPYAGFYNNSEGASRITVIQIGAINMTLNSTGIGWINLTGYTKLALRAYQDLDNVIPVDNVDETNLRISNMATDSIRTSLTITYNLPTSATCTCPLSGNWLINDGSTCTLTTNCNIYPNKIDIENGRLYVSSGISLSFLGLIVNKASGGFAYQK